MRLGAYTDIGYDRNYSNDKRYVYNIGNFIKEKDQIKNIEFLFLSQGELVDELKHVEMQIFWNSLPFWKTAVILISLGVYRWVLRFIILF